MLTPRLTSLPKIVKRNIGIMVPAMQKASDPIQQLFIDKIHEYEKKRSSGKFDITSTPEIQKELKNDLERLSLQYGGGPGVDMTKFPTFKFQDPEVEYDIVTK